MEIVSLDTVNILDSNDKATFTPQTQRTEISEKAEVGTIVHKLIATDPKGNEELDSAGFYL